MKNRNSRAPWLLHLGLTLGSFTPLASCGAEPDRESGLHEPGDGHPDEHGGEAGEHADEVVLGAEAVARHGVRVERVGRRVLVPLLRAPAQVAFNSEGLAHVGIPVRGRVAELLVRLGDEVEKGASLLLVESPDLGEAQSDFLLKQSAAANAVPGVDLARNAHERAQALYEKNQGIALTEVLRREGELRAAQAALAGAKASEDAARNRLRLLGMSSEAIERLGATGVIDPIFTVRAPIAGQVIEREATLGELVGPDREALLVLANMAKLWVVADVPEKELREVAVGAPARVLLGSGGDHWCEGVVSFVSPAINPATRTVQVRIEPTDRHPELRPGVFAQAEIEAASASGHEPVLAILASAVQTLEGESVVFVPVEGEEGAFARRVVTVADPIGGHVAVLSGLTEGERYVAAGSFILKAELGKSSAEHQH